MPGLLSHGVILFFEGKFQNLNRVGRERMFETRCNAAQHRFYRLDPGGNGKSIGFLGTVRTEAYQLSTPAHTSRAAQPDTERLGHRRRVDHLEKKRSFGLAVSD
jgi:hypothetical protein